MRKPSATNTQVATPLGPVSLPTVDSMASQFGSTTWSRGKQYAKQGAVLAAEVLQDNTGPAPEFEINAEVMGSDIDPYDQHIQLWTDNPGEWLVDGDCSCPVGHNCKHVAAVLVQVLEQDWFSETAAPQAAPDPQALRHAQWQAWLQSAEAEIRKQHEQATGKDLPTAVHAWARKSVAPPEFAYFLVLGTCQSKFRPGQWLTLTQGKAKPLKNKPGQWGKVVVPSPYANAFPGLNTDRGNSQVAGLYQRWFTGQQSSFYGWQPDSAHAGLPQSAVRDAMGLLVLQQAAQAGELLTLTPERMIDQRVQWGPDLPLSWAWQASGTTEDGSTLWALRPQLGDAENAAAQLFMGEPMVYFDAALGQCGHVLSTQMALPDVQRWLTLPPVSEQWIREQSLRLSSLLPHLPEAVQGHIAREIRGIKPVPCLHIAKHPQPSAAVFLMQLHFDYDGIASTWTRDNNDRIQINTPEGVVHLWRDLVEEIKALHTLFDQGYRSLNAHTHSEWQADSAMNPHKIDLALLDQDFAPFREAGFRIDLDPWLLEQQQQQGQLDMALREGHEGDDPDSGINNDWFSLSMGFTVNGQRINLLNWLPQLIDRWPVTAPTGAAEAADATQPEAAEHTWITDDQGQVWRIPTAPLRPWMAALMELMQERGKSGQGDQWQLDRFAALRLATAQDTAGGQAPLMLSADQSQSLAGLVDALRHPDDLAVVNVPPELQAQLRPYQQQGLNWMQHLGQHRLGGILADDMGLGKTLQTIAHLLVDKQQGRLTHPALVVAPTSLVGNWQSELTRFAPTLTVLILHGSERHGSFANIQDHDVVITTYPLLLRDEAVLTKTPWSVVVLDEAQAIKNARTRMATIVQALPARQRLCLTGTPMENHLGEVWSLFNFLMPGYLSSETRFKQVFRTPIEKHGDTQRMALLRTRLAPFMLRRTKAAVATELPPKVETVAYIELPPAQANLYEVIRVSTEAKIQAALQTKGLARSHIAVLDALLKLRQVCCDPRLVPLDAARKVKDSAKMQWLLDNLPAMIEEGRRVLLFSQFTSMLSLIEEALQPTGLKWVKLTGQSQKRDAIIARFTSGEVPLFLISLKAGGVGLNLPQADTVIHFDPWWNPAVEDQATDRAHRMGQQSTVFVHKLVAQGTLEERIVAMQARKAALAQGLHGGDTTAAATRLTEDELSWLLQPIGAAGSK